MNAQDAFQTRLCRGLDCDQDATSGAELCARCRQLGKPPHTPEQPLGEAEGTLWCPSCTQWKPDAAFYVCRQHPHRRHRHGECRDCCATRKRQYRANWNEAQRDQQRARDATRHALAAQRQRAAKAQP